MNSLFNSVLGKPAANSTNATRKNVKAPNSTNAKNATNATNATRKNIAPLPQMGGRASVGSRAQVWHGTADHTSGGLTKSALMMHKGRIVSRKAHAAGKKAYSRLVKAGYKAKKGTFKLFSKRR